MSVESLSEDLRELIENNNVVVFSKGYCPYCTKAKQLLQQNNVEFIDVNPDDNQLEVLGNVTGQGSVPNIWVKGTFIGGCNDGPESWMGLSKCLQSGKFQELLQG